MTKALFVFLAALAFAVSPFLVPEFRGFNPDLYPNPQVDPPVQPAGYAFAIWSVIYLWLLLHAGMGLWRYRDDRFWDQGRMALILSLTVGAIWLPVAVASPIWATVLIWVMLISAIAALISMAGATPNWAASLPVGLYAGWLTAASFVSIGLLGAGYGFWFEEFGWALTALSLATAFTLIAQQHIRLWTYGFGVIWGFLGVAVQNLSLIPTLSFLACVAALLVATLTVHQLRQR